MTIEYMREKVAEVFDGPRWRNRVAGMPNAQVIAIFNSFKKRGVFDSPLVKSKRKEQYRQMTIFDFMEVDQ